MGSKSAPTCLELLSSGGWCGVLAVCGSVGLSACATELDDIDTRGPQRSNLMTPNQGGAGGDGTTATGGGGGTTPDFQAPPPPRVVDTEDGGLDEPICGDGIVNGADECDDGNALPGDGCSPQCVQAPDFACEEGRLCVSTVVCGDRLLSTGEGCDDGNALPGDGCDASCQIEAGYICPILGLRCSAAECGDGLLAGLEQCEDGDILPGDGCDANCRVEAGYSCVSGATSPPSACNPTVCNDGNREGSEPCDDGNPLSGDGCTPLCEIEPSCPKMGGACSSSCGDGLVLPSDDEECDDGNTNDGDGCSATCTAEAGYECELVQAELPPTRDVAFTFRDFVAIPAQAETVPRHADFNANCGQHVAGMVMDTLDADGKPVNTGLCDILATCMPEYGYVAVGGGGVPPYDDCAPGNDNCAGVAGCNDSRTHGNHPLNGQDPFYYWYRDAAGINIAKAATQTMTLDANGVYQFTSTALFPFDNDGWVASGDELRWDKNGNNANGHNYGFTSEVRRWFQFQGGELLSFDGDDDVWVFVNGQLALDLGGVHISLPRTIRLNADGTADCKSGVAATDAAFNALADCAQASRDVGIEVGSVYEITLFHAERHTGLSNFRLGLKGFLAPTTLCLPVCGDGVVTPDEQCDNGEDNVDDTYGGCSTTCTLGPFCGDNMVNGPEACDLGAGNVSAYGAAGCAPGCVTPPRCGDGVLDSQREECDLGDGNNLGGYDGCAEDCQLGPFCGDGRRDEPQEECDDGNRNPQDSCSKCVVNVR